MKDLYTAEMLESLNGTLKKRWILVGIVSALLLAGFVWSAAVRVEWLSVVFVVLIGAFLVFYIEMFCRPLLDYRKLMVSALSGRSHDRDMEYVRTEPDSSSVDGVSCRSLEALWRRNAALFDQHIVLSLYSSIFLVPLSHLYRALYSYSVLLPRMRLCRDYRILISIIFYRCFQES